MAEKESQIDTLPGGEDLPRSVNIARFVACRSQEIQIMKNSLVTQSGTKLAFQTLPKHMRRRAMSHNVKRLPRRLRQIHLNQMKKSGIPTQQKRPSRKYRRRPRLLTEEYTRRSNKKFKWLCTHIWHAKRFRMVEKWGYKLPYRPCDKAFRACYRAVARHCLLQDLSYFRCIQISGDRDVIVHKFRQLYQVNGGLTVGAKSFINGNREGELTLHEMGNVDRTIGDVKFQWFPNSKEYQTKLWLWVHPAFYENVKKALSDCFNNCADILFEQLGNDLSRFRLTGPLSNAVLHDALIPTSINKAIVSESYLKDFLAFNAEVVKDQAEYWNKTKARTSTSAVSPHSIFSMLVNDPRFYLPKKRVKSVPDFQNCEFVEIPNNAAQSPLWNTDMLKKANVNIVPDSEIANLRGKLLVAGSDLPENAATVPVILIQQPGNKRENVGFGGGWDVVLPSAWAKPFWFAFIMRGARAGGLRESNSLLFEMGKTQFLQPDTEAGVNEELHVLRENVEVFFRKPPNKRVNYNKFKIVSPFLCNWNLLLKDWGHLKSGSNLTVLRDKNILISIEAYLKSNTREVPPCPQNCLIPVKLTAATKGCPQQFAIICVPRNEKDCKNVVLEPNCEDKLQPERKELRRAHQSLLKKLRKQRKETPSKFDLQSHKEILTNYATKMRALWLPEPSTIRHSCSREVVGFVNKGGFSFSLGKSSATGYIVSNGLQYLKKFKNRLLFRNTNSRQYNVARVNVILE